MLTDQEQQHIVAEERHRLAVRRQLEQKDGAERPARGRLLNTPFMVALVPSLAVVALPVIFTHFQQRITQASEEVEMLRKIDVEIGTRIDNALYRLASWEDPQSSFSGS